MTNATKTLSIIFAGTLALALASSLSWSASSSAAFQENLLAVDTSAVQAVRLDRGDAPSVRVEKEEGQWTVSTEDGSAAYPASRQAVNDLLRRLPNLSVDAVTTRQPEKHPRYGVDSTGTTVTLLGAGDESLGQLVVGRTQFRRPQQGRQNQSPMQQMQRRGGTPVTYVRSPDAPDVYAVETSLRGLATRSVEDWRRKQLWAVDRAQIQQVDVTVPGDSGFTARRAAPPDTADAASPDTWVSAGDTLATEAMSGLLRTVSAPEADGFVNDQSPDDFGEAPYTVQLRMADGSTRRLRLRRGTDEQYYQAAADGFPSVVQLRASTWNESVIQARSALLQSG